VSHELKTPLTAIRLHAETLERVVPNSNLTATTSVETIIRETDRLGLLIRDVLEFTRLENDKKNFVWEATDLVAVIQESVRLFSQHLEQAGFELSLDLPESLILERADRDALKQTATNLISNSLKFSPLRKTLTIRVRRNGRRALWEIEDQGLGITPQDLPHIFEKFYRGTTLDPAISGTGLGLALCKAFVEAHGGTIRVESSPNQGSRFIIELPVEEEVGTSG
jgi:signal transduction histidine kinase